MADRPFNLTPPEDNIVRRMIDEKLAREDAAFRAATEVNKSIPAADQAKAIPLAKENGIPTEVARRNLRELEAQKRQDSLRNIMLRSTSVSRLAADEDHGPIALEHADEIDQFEQMLASYKGDGVLVTLGKGVAQSAVGVAGGFAQFIATTGSNISPYLSGGLGVPTPTAVDRFMQPPLRDAPEEDKQAISKTVMSLTSDAEKAIAYAPIIDWERDLKAAFQRGEYGSALANVPGFAGEQLVVGLPNMLLAWFAPPVSLLAETGRVAQERAQNDGRDYVSGGDIAAAAPVGALITLGERLGLGKMLSPGKGLMAPIRGAAAEGATEFLQESGEYLGTTLGTQKGATLGGALEAGAAGFIGGAPGGAVVAGGKAILDAYVFRAEKRRQDLVDLGDKIRKSKVAAMSPDTLTALAQQIEKDGGPQMSVPAEKLVQLFQSEGFTPEQIEQQFPEVAKALDDAEQGNAEVPLNAESIIKLVSLEGFAAISGDVRTGPNERTTNELKQDEKDFDAFVETLSDEDKKAAVRASIEDQLTKQLVAAGQEPRAAAVQARLWSSVLTNIDERNVKDPGATLARYRLDITGNDSTDTAAMPDATLLQKDVLARTPELQEGIRKLQAGEITREDYAALVNKYKPVLPYAAVPTPATVEEMQAALTEDKVPKVGAPDQLQAGHPVGLRLDIPAYARHGTWVVSVHEQKAGFGAGAAIGYSNVARATDVDLGVVQNAAVNIAGGKPKATIATMKGSWKPTTPEQAKADADAALIDPAWRQIGMDPERHAFFYDRETMQPITAAEEVIQIGPLVLGKNVTYGDAETFLFQGGDITKTPEFRNWFGDSKVVDESGAPLVVYHGTNDSFDTFDIEQIGRKSAHRSGFAFSSNANNAATYGQKNPTIMPVFLKTDNPLVIDAQGALWRNIVFEGQTKNIRELADEAAARGYDGLIVRNVLDFGKAPSETPEMTALFDDLRRRRVPGTSPEWARFDELRRANESSLLGDTYIVFDPAQIKSVNNRGTFDPNDPNILFQSEQPAADATPAGGLTDKGRITVEDLRDAVVIPIFADLTDAGRVYDKLDGLPLTPTRYFGGPNFPWLKQYRDAGIVWAFNKQQVITKLRNHVRNIREKAKAEGHPAQRVVITVLAMKDDAHTSNEMTINALLRTLDAVVAAGRFPKEVLDDAKAFIVGQHKKKEDGYKELKTFPGFGDAQALHDWIRGATFTGRKALAKEMQSAKFEQFPGMFPVSRVIREAVDPDYRATQVGDALLAFEIDPDDEGLIVDFEAPETKAAGVERHPSYRYGMRGKLLGSFNTHIPMEVLYKDLLPKVVARSNPGSAPKFLMERLSNGGKLSAKGTGAKADFKLPMNNVSAATLSVTGTMKDKATGEETLVDLGPFTVEEETYASKTGEEKEAFFLKFKTAPPKGVSILATNEPDGQTITQDVIDHANVIEGLHDYRVAQAMTSALAGQWRTNDINGTKGGVIPVEFERALAENEAAVTLTKYTRDDVKRGKQDGSLRVFQLGTTKVEEGGLSTWFAIKKGLDYRQEYPGAVTDQLVADGVLTDNEVALVGVANNELGVKGMLTFQVLKAVEEGVTVLDCFKVKSANKPFGLLPTLYGTMGFEEVGAIPFDPQYFDDRQLADLKAVWSRQGWNEADGYPDVAIMKYRGSDALRSGATRRFILEGQDGLGIRPDQDDQVIEATQQRLLDSDQVSDQGDGRAGQGDGRADPRRFRDRAGNLAGEGRAYVRNVLAADRRATDALKLPPELINRIRERFPDLDQPKAPSPGPSSSGETTTLFQPFDGQGAPEASKAAQALADLKQTGFVTDQHVIGILGEFPGYLQEVAKFMAEQRQKLIEGRMTLRDVAKAYFITVSSMGSGAKSAEMVAAKTGMQVPQQFIENGKLRPEEAAAAWLGTPDGQAALDALEQGEFRDDLWQKGAAVRTAYGDDRHATMGSMKPAGKNQFSMLNLQGLVDEINATKGDSAKLQAAVTKLKGIGTGKQGFIGHLLGMGNVPTIDAVEINTWIAGQGDIAQLKNKRADLARRIKESSSDKRVSAELLDRITRRFEGLRKKVGADQVDPQVWQHIAHHWLWDRAKGIETTHGGLYEAMRFYQTSQTTTTTARGFIKFGPGRDFFQITLTGKADLSTFNHEMMHYALEVIQDLVQRGEASPQLVADLQKLREFAGLKDNEPIERRHHEQIARAWEAYVMEGRSPSADLQGVFNRMRAWMVFIYKRLAALDVELTDEVRGVFDRLVASDQQIAEARTQIGWSKPLPKDALFLSDDEYDRYVEAWNKASEAQQREVDAKLMLEAARETQAAWREERAKVMEEEQTKLAATRGHRAWKLLSEGAGLEDAAPGRTSLKIDPNTVPPEWRRDTAGMTAEDGLPFEAVAEILGFDSGEQMISLIAGAKVAEGNLSRDVKQIMWARHGDMDATALADAAMAAVHSDDTQEVLLTEFRAMASKAGIPAPPKGLTKWMAAQAAQKVRGLTRRQLDPTRWRRAELKAAADSAKAAAKGDMTKAAIHKRQQMMAAAMYRATVQADKRVDVIRKKLMPFTKNDRRAKLGKTGDLYLDGIDEILEAIQLKPMSAAAVQKLDRLQKLVEEADKNGEPLVLPDKLRAMLGKKNFQDMTLEELEGVHDAVMNIWHLAKLKNELKARNEKRDLEEALTEMEANARAALGDPNVTVLFTEGWKDRAAATMRSFRAGLTKMEFLFGWLDGKPDGGLMHRLIYQPIADANKAKFDILKRFQATIIERMRNMPKEQQARWESKRTFMGNSTANGATIISAALNLGNEGNKKKLLEGYGWNEQQLMAEINAFMTKADWDFVQHVWDEIDTLWPRIKATAKAATGLAPEKVVAAPVVTPFGTYTGGYYPAVYDPAQTEQQFKNQQESAGLFSNNYARPTLGDGSTKGRVDYAAPLLLKLDVISRHLAEVVHYVTHYEAVTQADKITRHPRFQAIVKGHMGNEFYRTIRPWLQDVARDQDTPAITKQEPFAKAMRHLRGGVSIAAMGYNIFTGVKQLIGIVQSLDAVGPKYWLAGLSKAWLSPNAIANWKFAFQNSQELEPLVTQLDRDIKMINDAYAVKGAMSMPVTVASWAFKHIGWLQAVVNVATWHGAYEQDLARNGGDHEKAVMHADAVVRMTQSAGAVKDLSPIQRGSEINRSVSMFYSWFNVLYNRLEDIARQTKSIRDVPKATARVAILVMMSSMIEEAGRRAWEAVFDNYEDDDEEAGYILSVLLKSADTAIGAIPLGRVFLSAQAASGGMTPDLVPAAGVVEDYWRTARAAYDLVTEGEAPSRGEVKAALRTVSILRGVPLSGPYNFLDELFGEAVFGEGKKTKP